MCLQCVCAFFKFTCISSSYYPLEPGLLPTKGFQQGKTLVELGILLRVLGQNGYSATGSEFALNSPPWLMCSYILGANTLYRYDSSIATHENKMVSVGSQLALPASVLLSQENA